MSDQFEMGVAAAGEQASGLSVAMPHVDRRSTGATLNTVSEVRIEEVVLHGFSQTDRYRIAAAIETELARLIVEHGLPEALTCGGTLERVSGGEFSVRALDGPERCGRQVAQAVYEGWSRCRR